ncbi:MAG: ATP-binding protein [Candidatus Velthaea sp.]
MSEFRAHYPSRYESVGKARRALIGYAAVCGFRGEGLNDIESAVGEALANAAEHGHRDRGGFEVVARMEDGRLIITIKDDGGGFERWNASDAIRPMSMAPRGFGIFIMRELMDEIRYSEHGSRLQLIKELPSARERASTQEPQRA